MNRLIRFLGCAVLLGVGWGCRNPTKEAAFRDIQGDVSNRIGLAVRWNSQSQDDRSVDAAVNTLLAHPLSAEESVQIALLNNRHLQARFEDLGIAQADLVQAGLLKNPVFDVGVRFPDRSPLGTYLDIGVAEDFLDIALLPARKKLAEVRFEEAKAEIVAEVLAVASDTRDAFVSYQASSQMLQLSRTAAEAGEASLEAAKRMRDAGNMDDLTFTQERENAVRARIELADAEEMEAQAREKATDQMGLIAPQTEWTASALDPIPEENPEPRNLESLAMRSRPDVAAARREIEAQSRMLGLTADFRFFSSADLGAEFERETDGQWRIGPSLSLPVPLFDLGDAKVSRAQAMLRQSEEQCLALIVDVQSQVRAAQQQMHDARVKAILYREELLPIENDLLHQTELRYNGMLAGVFQLLDAKRQQVDAEREYIDALKDYWIARSELERAVGGRFDGDIPTTQPQTAGGAP